LPTAPANTLSSAQSPPLFRAENGYGQPAIGHTARRRPAALVNRFFFHFRKEELIMATYQKNQLYTVALDELRPDPGQPRRYMDPVALDELSASVSRMGIVQPIVCRQDPATGQCYVVAGQRRCAAAENAGLAAVPAVFIDGGNAGEVALVENLLRQDLNPVEEAEALQRLMDEHAYQQEQLAAVIGKSQPAISKSLSINRLPQEIRDECRQDPTVPKNVLVEIARKKQERSMLTRFKKFREQQARAAAKETGDDTTPSPRKRTKAEAIANSIATLVSKIGDLQFTDFSEADRTMLIEAMTSLKETLEPAIARAEEEGKPVLKMKRTVGKVKRKSKR
jgi:ParB family transcriptional regulator, chromosome partitioning protein